MTPIEFPEMNATLAKDQPEYLPLPVHQNDTESISCWQFTWRERFAIFFGKPLWIRQMTFGALLQPQLPVVEKPFIQQCD